MAKKFKSTFEKGCIVYRIVKPWGVDAPRVDTSHKYKIRSIGEKQAIIEQIFEDGTVSSRRRSEFLSTEEFKASLTYPGGYYPTSWDQRFVLIGDAGWDF